MYTIKSVFQIKMQGTYYFGVLPIVCVCVCGGGGGGGGRRMVKFCCNVNADCSTFVCMSAAQPIHCLQGRKADALCLNPLNAVLAGLSAEMIVTAAQ